MWVFALLATSILFPIPWFLFALASHRVELLIPIPFGGAVVAPISALVGSAWQQFLPLPRTVVRVFPTRVEIDGRGLPFEAIMRCRCTDGILHIEGEAPCRVPDPDQRVYDALLTAITAFRSEQEQAPDGASHRARLARLRDPEGAG